MRIQPFALGLGLFASGCLSTFDSGNPNSGSPDMAGSTVPGPNDHSTPTPDAGGAPISQPDLLGVPPMDVTGGVTADTTWMGVINVKADVPVSAGVTLTVNPGTVINISAGFGITISGTLKVMGTTASPALFNPAVSGMAWKGITVASGGSATISNANIDTTTTPFTCAPGAALCKVDHTNMVHYTGVGAALAAATTLDHVRVEFGGSDGIGENAPAGTLVTITNSIFHTTGGDAIVVTSGDLTFSYNKVYGDVKGGGPGLHCANHFAGAGTVLADHNDFYQTSYGLMVSGLSATSKISNNNFYDDGIYWGPSLSGASAGVNPAVDFTNNYWAGAAPPAIMGNSKTTPYMTAMIAGTGPQP
jgi:hypothetical protein